MIANQNNHNTALLNNFCFHLKVEKGLSKNTLESYLSDVEQFLENFGKEAELAQERDIINFLVELQGLQLDYKSLARKRSSLKIFYNFLRNEALPIRIDFAKIPSIKYDQKIPEIISAKEMKKFLNSIDISTKLGKRNKALLGSMYACGLRVSEAIELTIHDILWSQQIIRVIGKGKKMRMIPIAQVTLQDIKDYMNMARQDLKKEKNTDVLFLNRLGGKLSRMGIWKIIEKETKKYGIKQDISPHTFRHCFATHLLQAGANLRMVQLLLGHSSINTTQIYTNIDKKYIREQHKKYHPRK
ncbi:MAG: tyrosine recombinase [Candidatus Cloacimonadota bacterium]|nr:tyrosine recombinase [Candidatus Cloacimonadota bacterium]